MLYSLAAQGGFKDLLGEFLSSHLQLKINKLEKSQATINRDLVRTTKTWRFSARSSYDNNQLDMAQGSRFLGLKTSLASLAFSKDFEWGAQLKLSNTFSKSDATPLAALVPGDFLLKSSTFQQSLTLSQDLGKNFGGQQFYTRLAEANVGIRLSEIVLSQKNQMALSNFYQNYLRARLRKTLLDLQEQALQRSQKRLEITRKRVRDGLNQQAEFYSAQIEHVRKQEEVTSAQLSLGSDLDNLSKDLRRQVETDEIEQVPLNVQNLTKSMDDDIQKNFEIRKLKEQLQKLNLELNNLKRQYIPNITLSGTYRTNDIDESSSQVFQDGNLTGSKNEYIIALNLNMPLNFNQERLNEARKKIEILSLEMNLKKNQEQLEISQKTLQREITTRLKNLKSSFHRIELSKKNLKESTRLYSIGRIDFDSLIRAEENLINTEKSYVNNWFQYEHAVAQKASLYARLLEVISNSNL